MRAFPAARDTHAAMMDRARHATNSSPSERPAMGEAQLLELALRGDRLALDELCRREWRPVYGIIYQAVQNRAEAQDLTQEVFLRALKSLDRYQVTGAPFHAYLGTIARNLLRDRWRKRSYPTADIDTVPEVPEAGPGPEQQILASSDRQSVEAKLLTLPEDQQTVIRLRMLESRSSSEVGELMGRSPAAVRQLQRRALLALRAALLEETSS